MAEVLASSEGHQPAPKTGLLVVIDQLEEIFQINTEQRTQFVNLLAAIAASGRLWLVTTLRSDFYPALQEDPALLALKERSSTIDVGAPSPADIREMIEGAARAAGLRLEDDGDRSLAELLENESVGPGSLPMLQFALQSLYENRDQKPVEVDRLRSSRWGRGCTVLVAQKIYWKSWASRVMPRWPLYCDVWSMSRSTNSMSVPKRGPAPEVDL